MPSLSIVLPAYNEEDAIVAVASAARDALPAIQREARLDAVEVLVVDDGSTDRTAELVRTVEGVRLVVLSRNRGYGAALKAGFDAARGSLLAFCDADGTCDPAGFEQLVRHLVEQRLDIVIGSRLGAGSRMPFVRRLGNRLFAALLGVLSRRPVHDTASGMRVLRRDVLSSLYPLPDGLNFTPAMTARALLSEAVSLDEVPIPYAERSGRSKLRVVVDGLQFLRTILETALLFQPFRILAPLGLVVLFLAVGFAIGPARHYLEYRRIEDETTYGFVAIFVFAILAQCLITAGVLAEEVKELFVGRSPHAHNRLYRWSVALLAPKPAALVAVGLVLGALVMDGPGLYLYLTTGTVGDMPWHRILVGGYLLITAVGLCVATLLAYTLRLVRRERAPFDAHAPAADRTPVGLPSEDSP